MVISKVGVMEDNSRVGIIISPMKIDVGVCILCGA